MRNSLYSIYDIYNFVGRYMTLVKYEGPRKLMGSLAFDLFDFSYSVNLMVTFNYSCLHILHCVMDKNSTNEVTFIQQLKEPKF